MVSLTKRAARSTRSLMVQNSKMALLIFAMLMGLSIIIIANLQSGEKGGRLVLSGSEKTSNADPMMVNPRYYGIDSKNRPFSVNAKNAQQKKNGEVVLEEVSADMLLNEQSWLALTALQGVIEKNNKDMVLSGAVNMFYEGGYELRSEYAKIFTEEGRAEGNQPIEGQGPTGTLKADSFRVTERGQKLYFKGNVHVTLFLDK